MVFAAFELLLARRALEPEGAVLGTGEKSQNEVKKSRCILRSCSPRGEGSPQRWETELPSSLGCSQDQADKGRGRGELMKGRDSSGPSRASRHLPGELPPPNLL